MTRPERYQLPFNFGRRPEQSLVLYQIGFAGVESQLDGSGRFVRQVREEIMVRSPYDAAQHLLDRVFTPFDAFDQEELYVLLPTPKIGSPTRQGCTVGPSTQSTFDQPNYLGRRSARMRRHSFYPIAIPAVRQEAYQHRVPERNPRKECLEWLQGQAVPTRPSMV